MYYTLHQSLLLKAILQIIEEIERKLYSQ